MPVSVLSPLPGERVALKDVPDPVFAQGLVGGGVAVEPPAEAGTLTAASPMDGTVLKVMPHAFIVQHASGPAVLVHVGIDTVKLGGDGFEIRAATGDRVSAGAPMVDVDVAFVRGKGLSASCPVVVVDTTLQDITPQGLGTAVATGDVLYTLPK